MTTTRSRGKRAAPESADGKVLEPVKCELEDWEAEEKPSAGKKARKGSGKKGAKKAVKKEEVLAVDQQPGSSEEGLENRDGEEEECGESGGGGVANGKTFSRTHLAPKARKAGNEDEQDGKFVGEPIPDEEARKRWPERYSKKTGKKSVAKNGDDDDQLFALRHYNKAEVEGCQYKLFDDVFVKAEDGRPDYIGRIVEFFESADSDLCFTAQWFFRVEDTVVGKLSDTHDPRHVFLSHEKNDNALDCIVRRIKIIQLDPTNKTKIPNCDFYYDMLYSLPYTSFTKITPDSKNSGSDSSSTISSEIATETSKEEATSNLSSTLLDLYSGCGAMSTGLCQGAHASGVKLETKWAVDLNAFACESLKLNHSRTHVRNESAEDFLSLIKEWKLLCDKFRNWENLSSEKASALDEDSVDSASREDDDDEFEVGQFLDICYGDPCKTGTAGLKLKVRWKGYGSDEDTWEPIDNMRTCEERLAEFVKNGITSKILPLPGDVDVICGGPPCQGISGFNRFRNSASPLDDAKNKQIIIYMDIVQFLKPKFVLMENVVDLLKFAGGYLGRYAISRLMQLNYQSRLGIMAAGCYGLPQFRLRAFLWGALPKENLPQFPLPTYNAIVRGGVPNEFERNLVAFDEDQPRSLKKALVLSDAISDLPSVNNDEKRDEMPYGQAAQTDFQLYIRTAMSEPTESFSEGPNLKKERPLLDHRPLQLNTDDYQRVQHIPKRKGANFRDLPGVRVRPDNVVELDPTMERVMLPSNKPLVPDYAISFVKGKSLKPFARLWWDETVPTVVTRAEPHNQAILHPLQDRVLTVRENARLQGFPDCYKLQGPIKERYIQVGNAVAVPVARALGYALGQAYQRLSGTDPLMTLPENFP